GVAGPAGRPNSHVERGPDDLDLIDPVRLGGDRVNEVVPGPVDAAGIRIGEARKARAGRRGVQRDVEIAAVKAEAIYGPSGRGGDVERIGQAPGERVIVVARDDARRARGVDVGRITGEEGDLGDPGRRDRGAHLAQRVAGPAKAGRGSRGRGRPAQQQTD